MNDDKKRDLYDEAKGHPHGGQHAGRQSEEGQHAQRPKPHAPLDRPDDKTPEHRPQPHRPD